MTAPFVLMNYGFAGGACHRAAPGTGAQASVIGRGL